MLLYILAKILHVYKFYSEPKSILPFESVGRCIVSWCPWQQLYSVKLKVLCSVCNMNILEILQVYYLNSRNTLHLYIVRLVGLFMPSYFVRYLAEDFV